MTNEEQQQVGNANFIEALRAQRTENADASANWFAKMMVEKTRSDKAEARVKELEEKYEPKPKLEAVA